MRALIVLFVVLQACAAAAASDTPCGIETYADASYLVCIVPRNADVALHLYDADGLPLGQFDRLPVPDGPDLIIAMNAGMYHADQSPVGLYVEEGVKQAPLVTRSGPGNFGMVPNGVFWSDGETVHVTETQAYAKRKAQPAFATQSGPMLVIEGELHSRFLPDSTSRKRRNGVGIAGDDLVLVISDAFVTFHQFATFFRDKLGTDNALYLDGSISRVRVPALKRDERGRALGPMLSVVRETG